MAVSTRTEIRLIAVEDLGDSQVTVVEKTPHGDLAVGISNGEPFAVSNRCRHLFTSLGKGRVTEDGCLCCLPHASLYDVTSGEMLRGPQGAFKPLADTVGDAQCPACRWRVLAARQRRQWPGQARG